MSEIVAVLEVVGNLSTVTASLRTTRVPVQARILRRVAVVVGGAGNSAGAGKFQVRINGTPIFATTPVDARLTLPASATKAATSATLYHPCAEGDLVSIDADIVPLGGYSSPISFFLTFDDLIGERLLLNTLVEDFYKAALARAPTGGELTTEMGLLNAALSTAIDFRVACADLGSRLFTGAEYVARARTNTQFVDDLYRAYLLRPGDEPDRTNWISLLATQTRAQLATSFGTASEFIETRVWRASHGAALSLADAGSFRGKKISIVAPTAGQVLAYNALSGQYEPGAGGGGGSSTLAGDVTGASGANVVERIRGRAVAAMPVAAFVADNFNDNTFDETFWSRTSSAQVVEQTSRLEITSGYFAPYQAATSVLLNLTNRQFQAKIVHGLTGTPNYAQWDMGLVFSSNRRVMWRFDDGVLKGSFYEPVVLGEHIRFSLTYSATAHAYLRIRHESATNTYFFETSTDGATWTARGDTGGLSTSEYPAAVTQVQFYANINQGLGYIYVDDFLTTIPGPDTILDGFQFGWHAVSSQFKPYPAGQVPIVTADPTTAPSAAELAAGHTVMRFNATNSKFFVWNTVGTPAWKSVTLA